MGVENMQETNGNGTKAPDYAALAREVAKLAAQSDRDDAKAAATRKALADAERALQQAVKR